jgi:hypothetical protein
VRDAACPLRTRGGGGGVSPSSADGGGGGGGGCNSSARLRAATACAEGRRRVTRERRIGAGRSCVRKQTRTRMPGPRRTSRPAPDPGGGLASSSRLNHSRAVTCARSVFDVTVPSVSDETVSPATAQHRRRRAGQRTPPPSSRTNWTRLVPPSVLTGHVSSLPPVLTGHVSSLLPY